MTIYQRYHKQQAAKRAADLAARERELAEIRGEVPTPAVEQAPAQPAQAVAQPVQSQPQQQRNEQHQKRR